ncbi:MAG: tetratricopeptide repeat protein, partial [Planctomycetales bacterium]|nr:tetratricopeptide repeat protein [Planctomycetales bacterium]
MQNAKLRIWIVFSLCVFRSFANADSADDQYRVAAAHYKAMRWDLAATEFADFLQKFPNDNRTASALYYLGESHIQQKDFAHAADAFSRFVVHHPSDARVHRAIFRWGESSFLAGDHPAARPLLDQFNKLSPDHQLNEYALYYLGKIAAADGNHAMAISWYEQLAREFPDSKHVPQAEFAIGVQHYRAGQLNAAMTQFGKVETDYCSDELVESRDLRVRTRYWMGVTQLARQEFRLAAKTLSTVGEISAEHRLASAATYFAGEAFRADESFEKAQQAYQMVVDRHSGSEWREGAIVGLLQLASRDGDHDKVDKLTQTYLDEYQHAASTVDALEIHARSLIKRQQFKLACGQLERALSLIGTAHSAETQNLRDSLTFMLAICQLGQEQWESALDSLQDISTQSDASMSARTVLARGCAKLELGQHEQAINDLNKALSELADESMRDRCRAKLVRAHLAQNNQSAAEQVFATLSHYKKHAHYQSAQRLADKFFQHEEYARALQYYQQLVADDSPIAFNS